MGEAESGACSNEPMMKRIRRTWVQSQPSWVLQICSCLDSQGLTTHTTINPLRTHFTPARLSFVAEHLNVQHTDPCWDKARSSRGERQMRQDQASRVRVEKLSLVFAIAMLIPGHRHRECRHPCCNFCVTSCSVLFRDAVAYKHQPILRSLLVATGFASSRRSGSHACQIG